MEGGNAIRIGAGVACLAIMITLTACGGAAADDVTVLAAASLTRPFTEIAAAFEAEHPGTRVALSFGASSTLALQIGEGAPADVFATADEPTMDRIVAAGLADAGTPRVFATNEMALIVEPGNPKDVAGVADLAARADLLVALCVAAAPCGTYADEIFRRAGLDPPEAGREANVQAVLTRVALGEADAGIVYVTDVTDAVGTVPIPDTINVTASYPITVLRESARPDAAAAFVAFVTSETGQAIMAAYGFQP